MRILGLGGGGMKGIAPGTVVGLGAVGGFGTTDIGLIVCLMF